MTAETTTDGPPTLGEITYETFTAVRYHGSLTTAWTSSRIAHKAWEAAGAAAGAAAIARLDTPAELAAAMTENVRLRKELHERDAQLADALTPTAADFDHAAEIMRLRGVLERLAGELEAEIAHLRATGVTRGNRDRQELATRIREALRAMEFDPEAPAEPQLAPALTPVEAVRTAVAEEWQPRVDALRATVRELLDCTGLDDGEKAEWLERAGIDFDGNPVAAAARQPQPAPELAAAMGETRELRELLGEMLRTFGDSSGDGWRSRVGQVKYRQWRKRAGLEGQ